MISHYIVTWLILSNLNIPFHTVVFGEHHNYHHILSCLLFTAVARTIDSGMQALLK